MIQNDTKSHCVTKKNFGILGSEGDTDFWNRCLQKIIIFVV